MALRAQSAGSLKGYGSRSMMGKMNKGLALFANPLLFLESLAYGFLLISPKFRRFVGSVAHPLAHKGGTGQFSRVGSVNCLSVKLK